MVEKLETLVFRFRGLILAVFAAFTLYSGFYAFQLKMTAGFEKQLPAGHEYIQTFQEYRDRLFGSNRIIVVLKMREGQIWNRDFFSTYKDLTDALFYMPGVARHTLTSLWTPNSRYFEITEDGFVADDVIPGTITIDNIDSQCVSRLKTASLATKCEPALQIIENNVVRGGFVGRLVANDFSAAMVRAELLDYDVKTGERLDYFDLADKLESAEGGLSHFGRGGGGAGSYLGGAERASSKKDDSQLKKVVRDSSKITREHLQGAMTQVMKNILFNSSEAAGTTAAMDTS